MFKKIILSWETQTYKKMYLKFKRLKKSFINVLILVYTNGS